MHTIETPFGAPGFLVLSGSRLYGMDTPESDYDYVGALIEPAAYRVGLQNFSEGRNHQHGFEQFTFKGDNFEGTVYSLWKLARMFAEGNPTSLCLLFAPPIRDDFGICTAEFREMVCSIKSGHRFLKYMQSQREDMLGGRVPRKDLVARYGYDTKFAGHVLRLGYQGCEFLATGKVTLPMEHDGGGGNCIDVRNGLWTKEQVLSESEALERRMEQLLLSTHLPEGPNYEALDAWIIEKYLAFWS